MKRRCACAKIETLLGTMPGEREFERIIVPRPDLGKNIYQNIFGLWYCTNCGAVIFVPEEKPHAPGCMCSFCGEKP